MSKLFLIFNLVIILFISSCSPSQKNTEVKRSQQVEQVAKDFFATFAQRKDWEKFCSFYREDLVFDDVLLQLHLDSLWRFKRFYKWDEAGKPFRKLSPEQQHITIESLVVNDSIAVGIGRINPFYYHDRLIDAEWGMEVTFWLYFDENLKIKKQIDWIEYDAEVLENVIKHYKEKGVNKTPEWLDLSKREP
jgi:hypothetical protein